MAPSPSSPGTKAKRPPRQGPPVSPPEPPLAAEILSRAPSFGPQVAQSGVPAWHYWPAVAVAGLLSGLSYALLLRPSLDLAAQAAREAGQVTQLTPTLLTHISNGFGSVFLTALTFGAMWGLGQLGARMGAQKEEAREAVPVPQVFSASFTLPLLLNLLVIVLVLLTPASTWALDPARVAAAHGQSFALQRVALAAAAHSPAALVLLAGSLIVTAGQCWLAYRALAPLTPRAAASAFLPLLPALGLQLLGLAPLLVARAL